jgi:hypothetical protein
VRPQNRLEEEVDVGGRQAVVNVATLRERKGEREPDCSALLLLMSWAGF